jgi:hypothetical protein
MGADAIRADDKFAERTWHSLINRRRLIADPLRLVPDHHEVKRASRDGTVQSHPLSKESRTHLAVLT